MKTKYKKNAALLAYEAMNANVENHPDVVRFKELADAFDKKFDKMTKKEQKKVLKEIGIKV